MIAIYRTAGIIDSTNARQREPLVEMHQIIAVTSATGTTKKQERNEIVPPSRKIETTADITTASKQGINGMSFCIMKLKNGIRIRLLLASSDEEALEQTKLVHE